MPPTLELLDIYLWGEQVNESMKWEFIEEEMTVNGTIGGGL